VTRGIITPTSNTQCSYTNAIIQNNTETRQTLTIAAMEQIVRNKSYVKV